MTTKKSLLKLICFALLFSFLGLSLKTHAQVEPRPARKGSKYKVRIDSAPQQAAVYLDDEKYGIVGYTPWSGRLQVGVWKVIVKKDGYQLSSRMVEVKRRSRTQETFVPMVKMKILAMLNIGSAADPNVNGAEVWVDGEKKGNVPFSVKLANGRHQIEVKKEGFDTFSQWVEANEGATIAMTPMLRMAANTMGSILVDADESGADVLVDGIPHKDKTPTMITNVVAGNHVIEVRKSPFDPYRETVIVEGGQTIKIKAKLKSVAEVTVQTDVTGARVFVDGKDMGAAPADLNDLQAGKHTIEVRAPGYPTQSKVITVEKGVPVNVTLSLADALNAPKGTLKIVAAEPGAQVFVDGSEVGVLPYEQNLVAGSHMIEIVNGEDKRQKQITIEEGKTLTFDTSLRGVGAIRFSSDPSGADIVIDGNVVGQTPMVKDDLSAGDHVVIIRKNGYFDKEQMVAIQTGETIDIAAGLDVMDTGPTAEELKREQRGLTTFGARTLPKGRTAIDMGTGFPYLFNGAITVGAGQVKNGKFGLDAGVAIRSYVTRNELILKSRVMLFNEEPFSAGVFGEVGIASSVFDDSKRGGFLANAGAAFSLTGLGAVTITARSYLNFFVDRSCPSEDGGAFESDSEPVDTCKEYLAGTLSQAKRDRLDNLFGGSNEVFTKDSGLRLMMSFIVELALQQQWSLWGILEGAPFQGERTAYIDDFHPILFERDRGTYFSFGATYKF